MWDVQTGGLIHTFTTQPEVNDVALSTSGDHIASGSSDGSVTFWNICTKKEGEGRGNGQPVVTICWLSPQKFAVATRNSLYIRSITSSEILDGLSIPNPVWGMVHFRDKDEFVVGTSQPDSEGNWQELYSLGAISSLHPEPLGKRRPTVNRGRLVRRKLHCGKQSPTHPRKLTRPTIVGREIACIAPPSGVLSFSTESYHWTNNLPLLDAATSVAVSLNRNLVVQTKDSIQIFSVDVLASHEVNNYARVSCVYPLGKRHILCALQQNSSLALLELETMQKHHPDDVSLPFKSLFPDQTLSAPVSFCSELVSGLDLPRDMVAKWVRTDDEVRLLCELSPARTKMVVVFNSTFGGKIWIRDTKSRGTLALLDRGDNGLENGEVYDIVFDSEARFYLRVADGPKRRGVQIPYDITASPSDRYPYTIIKGELVFWSEPRATPPYTLDANCEWVLDAQFRKICWISPGNLRRGNGDHFWAGSSLVMVGDDGVVRKVSFKEPDRRGILSAYEE